MSYTLYNVAEDKEPKKCEKCKDIGREYFAWEKRNKYVSCKMHRIQILTEKLIKRL